MFNFNSYNTKNTISSSTGVQTHNYEMSLIQILCLPLACNTRQLQMPEFIQEEKIAHEIYGEKQRAHTFADNIQGRNISVCLNEVCTKLNVDVSSSGNDNTHHDTFESLTVACNAQECGEDLEDLTKVLNDIRSSEKSVHEHNCSPDVTDAKSSSMLVKVTEIPMSEEEKRKKGLVGLQFKTVKFYHSETKRSRTKFVCTFENCGKVCENKWSFLDHNRHHTGVKPYECEVCQKTFAQRGNLKQHKQTHVKN